MPSRYQELPPDADLSGHLQCAWTWLVERVPGTAHVLPDACIDIMWLGTGQLVVAGPDTGPRLVPMPPGTSVAAVRFRPGAAPALLGAPAAAILDQTVPLAELWGRSAAERLAERMAATGPADRVAALQAAIRERLPDTEPVDPMIGGLVSALRAHRSRPVAVLADTIGLSERQLHRRCVAAFGYGAKTLDRVLRLQRFLVLGRSPGGQSGGLAGLAVAAGYTDQSHLTHDCRALTGLTPAGLLG